MTLKFGKNFKKYGKSKIRTRTFCLTTLRPIFFAEFLEQNVPQPILWQYTLIKKEKQHYGDVEKQMIQTTA